MTDTTRDFFDVLARILLRCWVFGFLLLLLWGGLVLTGSIYKLHGPIMQLSRHELELIHYCGLGLFKLLVLTLFFFPWLAIRLILRKKTA